MNEQQWLACADVAQLLTWILANRGQMSDRRERLLACACCRTLGPVLQYADLRNAILMAEEFSDGRVTVAEIKAAGATAGARARSLAPGWDVGGDALVLANASDLIWKLTRIHVWGGVTSVVGRLSFASHFPRPTIDIEFALDPVRAVREIVGNPFRPVAVERAWLTWEDGSVVKMAQRIYDERAFDGMPILADALEEAGCTSAELITHCREPGPHVRGCWALDLLLGKT